MEELVLYFSLKYNGDFQKIYNALKCKESVDEQLRFELKKGLKCRYTTLFSHDYPEQLKTINCPPFVLYYYGSLQLLRNKTIAMIGMRDMSDYGKDVTRYFARECVNHNYVIVSGMAKGVDSVAHQTALDYHGKTVAILGTGIDYCYPRCNKDLYEELCQHHLVLSEYPYSVAPKKYQFPFRNRIVAGLSQSVLISEARQKSGTMITAGYALEQGKDVYCVPSRINDYQGCNELIKQGAKLVTNIEDILEDEVLG